MITLPRFDKRTAVIGSTGSGKTFVAVWLLSLRDYMSRPWVIFDFKGDALIEKIGAQEISIHDTPPKKAGIYVVRPIPELDDKAVENFLWKCWGQGEIGLYVDEGYMLGARNPALNACLTQGRSKHIEMIILSQRPVWMSKFVFSEANYFIVMNLTLDDDRKFVSGYVGGNKVETLPKFHSLYYDVENQKADILGPVPNRDALIKSFRDNMGKRKRMI